MNLQAFEGKRVRITDVNGSVYSGWVSDYIWADDQPDEMPQEESIILENSQLIEVYKSQIKSIELLSE